ncbi:unnamed protein product [Fusarium venenatum]|uniref:Uncharacterized protein n=1 Tax=Fusarium venenatum TaxID=56646 RepID=A0A2L2TRD2_9HYPO|nr:uncharacterized protein FVRRES_08688 [Fusarium venenatum]CEI68611.1 unnamed protein product [Fusarium venenatum]
MCWYWCRVQSAAQMHVQGEVRPAGCRVPARCQVPAAAEQVMGKRDPKGSLGPLGHRIARSANPSQPMTRQDKQLLTVESLSPVSYRTGSTTRLDTTQLPPNGHLYPTLTPRAKGGKPHGLNSGVKGRCQLRIQAFAWRAKSSIWGLWWGQLTCVSGESHPDDCHGPVDVFLAAPSNWME